MSSEIEFVFPQQPEDLIKRRNRDDGDDGDRDRKAYRVGEVVNDLAKFKQGLVDKLSDVEDELKNEPTSISEFSASSSSHSRHRASSSSSSSSFDLLFTCLLKFDLLQTEERNKVLDTLL
eukprot:TRINITY_DN17335_c0_g1_i1.p1 TRINITY_DN17335_c0_g1~~TRINITY_DN17335_c0_g1_i1.p1  ORF type:complete len:120 (-),score=53.41 TRINITY_DN17335_c0_g1_i1:29-388(-)